MAGPGHVSFTELLASVGGSGLASVGGSPYATSTESGRNGARFSGVGGIEFVEADAEGGEAGAPCSFGIRGIRLIEGDAEGGEAEPPYSLKRRPTLCSVLDLSVAAGFRQPQSSTGGSWATDPELELGIRGSHAPGTPRLLISLWSVLDFSVAAGFPRFRTGGCALGVS